MDYKFDEFKYRKDRDPELEKLLDELSDVYDRLMLYVIKKDLGVNAEIIDDEHICVDGVVMDSEEFAEWLEANYPYDDYYEEDKPHYYDA